MSLPLRKCGLKSVTVNLAPMQSASLPLRKCGLKSKETAKPSGGHQSLPLRKCGLKQHQDTFYGVFLTVTSLAEVWIEILSRSTYGNPRSKCYHHKYYKDLLKSLDLPDIHFHQLRNTYATILLKNSFNSKGVSHLQDMPRKLYPQMSMEIHRKLQKTVWTYWNHLLKKLFQKRGKISIMIIQK